MPVMPSGFPPVRGSEQDIHFIFKEQERVQASTGALIGRYASDEEGGLGIPTSLARFDHQAQRLVVTNSEAANPNSETTTTMTTQQQLVIKEEEQRFHQALRDYEKNVKLKYRTGLDIDGKHTLAEVWEILDKAIEKYENAD
ncbi:hypothetical protein BJX66DRAFT_283241 [Aspergillus keveii]|uniref:Uncharacterized protein n=1 Tax=Aspergillus keveii TaxID=714993 RepID=A0ABR4FWA0_9EURO